MLTVDKLSAELGGQHYHAERVSTSEGPRIQVAWTEGQTSTLVAPSSNPTASGVLADAIETAARRMIENEPEATVRAALAYGKAANSDRFSRAHVAAVMSGAADWLRTHGPVETADVFASVSAAVAECFGQSTLERVQEAERIQEADPEV